MTVCRDRGMAPSTVAEACLRGGARILQIRWKSAETGELLALADQAVRLARSYGAQIIINDRADVARLAAAAGVHVGQDDLDVDDARAVAGATAVVGVSTHDRAQIDAALASSASYVAVGPVFSTATKDTGYDARGLELVTYAANRGKPVVAIGGITLASARSVIVAGAAQLAVISDLLVTGDPENRVREYVAAIG